MFSSQITITLLFIKKINKYNKYKKHTIFVIIVIFIKTLNNVVLTGENLKSRISSKGHNSFKIELLRMSVKCSKF